MFIVLIIDKRRYKRRPMLHFAALTFLAEGKWGAYKRSTRLNTISFHLPTT
ncbi:MAG: hypothetical protein ACI8VI_000376 [Granulosicoccus sp.]|jgi:hypothetical protein